MTYHVNVTDVDDKIIKRARRNKLIADFVEKHSAGDDNGGGYAEAKKVVDVAVATRLTKLTKKLESHKTTPLPETANKQEKEAYQTELDEMLLKLKQVTFTQDRVVHIDTAVTTSVAAVLADIEGQAGLPPTPSVMAEWSLSRRLASFVTHLAGKEAAGTEQSEKVARLKDVSAAVESTAEGQVKALAAAAADELGETLDEELGSTVRDHAIFNEHARKYEREFMEDLELLGVRPPDVLTRVTECVTLLCVIVPLLASSFYRSSFRPRVFFPVNGCLLFALLRYDQSASVRIFQPNLCSL